MSKFISQFMTEGMFDYKKFNEHRSQMLESLESLEEEPDNDQFTQEVKTAEDKSQGKGKKAEVAKPSVQAVKQEAIEVIDANEINGVRMETIAEGKKWIAGAIKKPGALHKQLGVPEGEKIPTGKLEKAAEAPGKLGKRARLAKTLKSLRKESVEQMEEETSQEAEVKRYDKEKAKWAGRKSRWDAYKQGQQSSDMKKESVEPIEEGVSRKHFQQVADVIKSHPDAAKRAELAKHHAEIFKKQNPRFDHHRFYAAANAQVNEEMELDEAKDSFGYPSYSHEHVIKKLKDGEWETSYDVKKGKHNTITDKRTGKQKMIHVKEDVEQIAERELTPAETKKKEEVVMSMKKNLPSFKERYGKRAKEVLYATATKQAKKD